MFIVRPIRTDEDHQAALAEVDHLWGAEPGSPESDTLEVLAILIDDYERQRWPVERVDPVDAIKAHMEMNGLGQSDLSKLFGSVSRASEILHRHRRLTVDMIAKLSNEWGIPADWLVQPYDLAVKAESVRHSVPEAFRTRRLLRKHGGPVAAGKGTGGEVRRAKKAAGAGD